MGRSTLPITWTRALVTQDGSLVFGLALQQRTASLFGLRKGDSVQGSVCEVRPTSVNVRLESGAHGWAHGLGLGLGAGEQPCDRYREGDWVTAEVAGLDYESECFTLSIRSHFPAPHYDPHPRPPSVSITPQRSHSGLERIQSGDQLWASVQEVRETGLRVREFGGDAIGWIDHRVAGVPEGDTATNRYRTGQLISVWVTGINYSGGEFTARIYPFSSPQPVTINRYEAIQ